MIATTETYAQSSGPGEARAPAMLCTVLAPSCDAYSDLWRPFFAQFFKHWPDCPFPVCLGSNQQVFDDPRVRTITADHGNNWTNRVREQLRAIETPYVLMILEDFFLRAPVSTATVLASLDFARAADAHMVRLVPRPAPDRAVAGQSAIGEVLPGSPYRLSTQAAIWKRETLIALMRDNESIWQFELDGSPRSASLPDGFYAVWAPVMTYGHHVVERGKWFRSAAAEFGPMAIGCDFSRRGIMTRRETLKWYWGKVRNEVLNLIPRSWRSSLKHAIRGSA
jgi:hypothetical protein